MFTCALSNQSGKSKLSLPVDFQTNHGIAFINDSTDYEFEKLESFSIETKKLSEILDTTQFIDVIKIDVEGHELNVLKGAYNLLNTRKINNIIYEDHIAYPSEVFDYLKSFGYLIYRVEKKINRLNLIDPRAKSGLSSWDAANYLATLDVNIFNKINNSKGYIYFKQL